MKHITLYSGGSGGGGANGIRKVPDAATRTALTPVDGDFVIQLDTDQLWYWDGAAWVLWAVVTDHQALLDVIQGLADHIADNTDAHDASAISVVPTGNIAADDVQEALQELQGDIDGHATELADHEARITQNEGDINTLQTDVATLDGRVDGHDIAITNLQGADTALDSRLDALELIDHVAVSLGAFGSTPNAKGITGSGTDSQTLNLEPADDTHPGSLSIAAQAIGGEKRFASGVNVGATAALAANIILQVNSTTKGSVPMPKMTTAQKAAIGTPTEGMMAYDTDLGMPVVFNGTNWEPISGYAIPGNTTVADAGTLTLGKYTKQVQGIGGNGGPSAISIDHTALKAGSVVVLVGTDDTNPVTFSSNGTTLILNGNCVLGLDDQLQLVKTGTVLREVSRGE